MAIDRSDTGDHRDHAPAESTDHLRFDDIAPFGGSPPAGTAPADRADVAFGRPLRRDVLRGFGLAGMALAMQVVGVVPLKRAWAANRYGYRLVDYPDGRCFDYNCVPGCGPSKVCGTDSKPYGHCCARYVDVAGVKPNGFWHDDGDRETDDGDIRRYRLRPGQCYGADAWIWRVTGCGTTYGGCGSGRTTTFRCHDGWYKLNGKDNRPGTARGWTKTICKHRYLCG